jgi:hypothetical protein
MSYSEASRRFGVPRRTLSTRVNNPFLRDGPGAPTFFTQAEEEIIANLCRVLCREKQGISLEELNFLLQDHVNDRRKRKIEERGLSFVVERDGFVALSRKWFERFRKAHGLTLRVCEKLSSAQSKATKKDLQEWFQKHEEYFRFSNVWHDVMQDPRRIFNVDETWLPRHKEPKKVIAPKGKRCVQRCVRGEPKQGTSVVVCGNAAGELGPITFIFPGKNNPRGVSVTDVPQGAHVLTSTKGWQTKETFLQYMEIFITWMDEMQIMRPVVLFVDLHASRMCIDVMNLARNASIILTGLPPNSTYVMQPLDVAVMHPIKTEYGHIYGKWCLLNNTMLSTSEFLCMAMEAITTGAKKANLQAGFRACGLYPWNPDNVHYENIPSQPGEQQMLFAGITEGVQIRRSTPAILNKSTTDRSVQVSQQYESVSYDIINMDTQECTVDEPNKVAKDFCLNETSPEELFVKDELRNLIADIIPLIDADKLAHLLAKGATSRLQAYFHANFRCQEPCCRSNPRHVDEKFLLCMQNACGVLQNNKKPKRISRKSAHREIYKHTQSLVLSSSQAICVMTQMRDKTPAEEHKGGMTSSIDRLQCRATSMGKIIKNNNGEGNCFFLAVAEQMQDESYITLRRKAVDEMRRSPDKVMGFYPGNESLKDYLCRMAHDGTWVDHPTIQALSTCIQRCIHIIAPTEDRDFVVNAHLPSPIYLGHIPEEHYVSFLPQECPASYYSDDCSIITTTTNASQVTLPFQPIPLPVFWFVVMHEGTPRLGYRGNIDGLLEEPLQELTVFAEKCDLRKKVYSRVGEESIQVDFARTARQVERATGRCTRNGSFWFHNSNPLDMALLSLLAQDLPYDV